MATYPYPDEHTFWTEYTRQVQDRYARAGRAFPDPNDPDAFRWFSRCGYDSGLMPPEAAAAKHLRGLEEACHHSLVLKRANGVKWAVLSDGKSAPMYGKDGDIIDGKYLIVKIGTESIEMMHADGRGRQVIRLNGQ